MLDGLKNLMIVNLVINNNKTLLLFVMEIHINLLHQINKKHNFKSNNYQKQMKVITKTQVNL